MFEGLLIHKAEVWRVSSPQLDRFKQPKPPDAPWATFKCRLSEPKGGQVNNERSHELYQVSYSLYLEADADVNEDDEIVVRDRDGDLLVPRARIEFKKVIYDGTGARHHIELRLETHRGPT